MMVRHPVTTPVPLRAPADDWSRPAACWLAAALSVMLAEGYLELFVVKSTATGAIVAALVLIPLLLAAASGHLQLPIAVFISACLFVAVMLLSALLNGSEVSLVFATAKVDLLPIAAILVGMNILRLRTVLRVLPVAAALMTLNAAVAVWQSLIGVEGLLAHGYVYAQTVRNFGSAVRAFGLLPRDNILGQVAGIFLILSVWVWLNSPSSRRWAVVLGASSVVSLILSRNRTAEVVVVLAVIVVIAGAQTRGGWLTRAKAALALGAMAVAVAAVSTLGTLDSLAARLSVWANAVSTVNPLWGGGPGHAGVAASTTLALSVGTTNVGDNNYVTLFANVGLLGILACLPFIIWLVWRCRAIARPQASLAAALLLFLLLAMITDNLWEEVPSALILLLLIGCTLRSDGGSSGARGDQRALSGSVRHRRPALRA